MQLHHGRSHPRPSAVALLMAVTCTVPVPLTSAAGDAASPAIGARGDVGCRRDPTHVRQLSITKPGVYENILVGGEWGAGTLVKIQADGVTLRNCEIRNETYNAVTVYATDVVIDSCKIHYAFAGTYAEQQDARGITGGPTNLTIRNCYIGLTSGDSIQFDPGRGPWDNVGAVIA